MLRTLALSALLVGVACDADDDAAAPMPATSNAVGPASFAGAAPPPVPPPDPATHRPATIVPDAVDGTRAPREVAP